jgi:hypothetical protein
MRAFKGFGSLKTPMDLLQEIRYDSGRLCDAPDNIYAAFDFFVTACHMLDWLHPNDDKGRKDEETKCPLLQICSHLANGANHFEATAKQHTSVDDVVSEEGAFQPDALQPSAFQVGGLFIRLDGQAASLFGAKTEAVDFAQKVLAHWEFDARLIKRSSQ